MGKIVCLQRWGDCKVGDSGSGFAGSEGRDAILLSCLRRPMRKRFVRLALLGLIRGLVIANLVAGLALLGLIRGLLRGLLVRSRKIASRLPGNPHWVHQGSRMG